MAEKIVREILIKVSFEPGSPLIETAMTCKEVNAGIMWEALKTCIINMTKLVAWEPDPDVRELLSHASHGMKLSALGVDQAVTQIRERRKNQNKELSGGTT